MTLRRLVVLLALFLNFKVAYGQAVGAGVLRLRPSSLPTTCNTGDIRVDTDDSNIIKICRVNAWSDVLDLGAASFTASKAVVTDASGFLSTSTVSATEVGHLGGVSSALCGINQTCTQTFKTFNADNNTFSNFAIGDEVSGTVAGNFVVTGTLNNTGAVSLASTLNVVGNTTIAGTLITTGAATFINSIVNAGTLSNTGAATFANNVTVTGTLNVTGAATLISHLTVGGNTTVAALDTGLSTAGPVITDSSGVLSSEAKLAIARGGTNNETLAVTAGGALYTDGSKVMNTGVGTAGQFLMSNGSSAPSFVAPWYVKASLAGDDPDLGTVAVTAYTEITHAGLTLTPYAGSAAVGALCASTTAATTPATAATTCAATTESVGFNVAIPAPGAYEVCAAFSVEADLDTADRAVPTFQIIETATNDTAHITEGGDKMEGLGTGLTIAGGADAIPRSGIKICGIFNYTATGTKAYRVMYELVVTNSPASILLLADANTSFGQRDVNFTMNKLP